MCSSSTTNDPAMPLGDTLTCPSGRSAGRSRRRTPAARSMNAASRLVDASRAPCPCRRPSHARPPVPDGVLTIRRTRGTSHRRRSSVRRSRGAAHQGGVGVPERSVEGLPRWCGQGSWTAPPSAGRTPAASPRRRAARFRVASLPWCVPHVPGPDRPVPAPARPEPGTPGPKPKNPTKPAQRRHHSPPPRRPRPCVQVRRGWSTRGATRAGRARSGSRTGSPGSPGQGDDRRRRMWNVGTPPTTRPAGPRSAGRRPKLSSRAGALRDEVRYGVTEYATMASDVSATRSMPTRRRGAARGGVRSAVPS